MAPKSRKRRPRNGRGGGTSDQSNAYFGPIRTLKGKEEDDTKIIELTFNGTVSSSAAPTIAPVYGNTDWSSTVNKFASYLAIWAEARTLGFSVEWIPLQQNSPTYDITALTNQIIPVQMVMLIDRVSSAALTQLNQNNPSAIVFPNNAPGRKLMAKMRNAEESQFQQTASLNNTYFVKFYSATPTASKVYGGVQIVYRVQFRGRVDT